MGDRRHGGEGDGWVWVSMQWCAFFVPVFFSFLPPSFDCVLSVVPTTFAIHMTVFISLPPPLTYHCHTPLRRQNHPRPHPSKSRPLRSQFPPDVISSPGTEGLLAGLFRSHADCQCGAIVREFGCVFGHSDGHGGRGRGTAGDTFLGHCL